MSNANVAAHRATNFLLKKKSKKSEKEQAQEKLKIKKALEKGNVDGAR